MADRKPKKRGLGASFRAMMAAVFGPTIRTDQDSLLWRAFGLGGGGNATSSGTFVNETVALGHTAVYGCIRVLCNTVGPLPVMLVRESEDGATSVRVTDHPVSALLKEPNTPGGFGMNTLMKTSQLHYNLGGEDFMQIERDEHGFPIRLWPLDPSTQALVDPHVRANRGIVGYRTTIQGVQVDLPPGDVLHPRNLSLDGITVISPVRAAAEAIGVGIAIEEFVGQFYRNYCMTGGYFTTPGRMSEPAQKNFLESVDKQTKGGDGGRQHFKSVLLEEGVKYTPITVTPQAAELGASKTSINEAVARVYGVPLVLLMVADGSTVWGTGIESLLISFTKTSIVPIVTQYEEQMTLKLLTVEERLSGLRIKFDISALQRGDAKSVAESNNVKIQNGSKTINEARKDDGLNPVPWGNEPPAKPEPAAAAKKPPGDDNSGDDTE